MSSEAQHRADPTRSGKLAFHPGPSANAGTGAARKRGRLSAMLKLTGSTYRVLAAPKSGPTLYDLCDPLLLRSTAGNAHLRKLYKKALSNPALRLLLARAGLPQLGEDGCMSALRESIVAARDHDAPDWAAIGAPVAALIDGTNHQHPKPKRVTAPTRPVSRREIDRIIRAGAKHLVASYAKHGFIPCYAAFNLIGDPDLRGHDLLTALRGINARPYKNSTLLFNLARVFIANSPAAELINPPWTGIAEPMWQPVQIRHRSAYYDAFFAEALMDFLATGLGSPEDNSAARHALQDLIDFCLQVSRDKAHVPDKGRSFDVVTALVPPPHSRLTGYFANIKHDLGFDTYLADCDTTSCVFSVAAQFGSQDPILEQPMLDFYAAYQVGAGTDRARVSVPLNDHIDYDGGIVTWIDNLAGERPFGNDLDPTLNLDFLDASFRNHARWQIADDPQRVSTVRKNILFHRRLAESGAFADPRSHIYYLPELYCAYFGRCYSAFEAMPASVRQLLDPDGSFNVIRGHVLDYVVDELIAAEMNVFDAALALLALTKLHAELRSFAAPLACIVDNFGEGRRGAPYKAYEWNKMKTPTRILVGGPEVTSAFVLSALANARRLLNF
jgi:hypothetical protein